MNVISASSISSDRRVKNFSLFGAAFIAASAFELIAGGTVQAATVFTSPTAFAKAVSPGSYTETFDSMGDGDLMSPTLTFGSGAFSFTASTGAALPDDNDLFGADTSTAGNFALSSTIPSNLTFTFPGGDVTAVGGDFTLTDDAFKTATDTFQLTLSDGTTVNVTSSSAAPFVGFTSYSPITSLTFVVPADATTNGYYATVDNLTVGTSVPEPTSLAFAAVGGVGLLGRRRRRAGNIV